MSSSWHKSYDRYKDRRYGSLFFSMFLGVLAFIPATALVFALCRSLFPEYPEQIFEGTIAVVCLYLFWIGARFYREIADARRSARTRANLSKLSSDEREKARSKLLKKQDRTSL